MSVFDDLQAVQSDLTQLQADILQLQKDVNILQADLQGADTSALVSTLQGQQTTISNTIAALQQD